MGDADLAADALETKVTESAKEKRRREEAAAIAKEKDALTVGLEVRIKATGEVGTIRESNDHACKVCGAWFHKDDVEILPQCKDLSKEWSSNDFLDAESLIKEVPPLGDAKENFQDDFTPKDFSRQVSEKAERASSPKKRLTRLWAGGLTSAELDLHGGPILEFKGTGYLLNELYDVEQSYILGAGKYGVVCPGRHHSSQRPVTVKMVAKQMAATPDPYRVHFVESGGYECLLRMTNDTPHPNVVHYVDLLEGPLFYYVVMERLNGPQLFDYVKEHAPLSECFCQKMMRQLSAALLHLHDTVGIYHRDVKLENLRFRHCASTDELVLLDFGLARFIGQAWDGCLSGTLMYLAPEVANCEKKADSIGGYSPAVDLWASGVVLYILLTAKIPFTDDQVWELEEHGHDAVAEALADDALRSVSLHARDLLQRLLTISPKERISANDMARHSWFVSREFGLLHVPKDAYKVAWALSQQSSRFERGAALSNASSMELPYFGE